MANKVNSTCSICGKGYYKCLSCQSEINAAPWKRYTDTSEHYKIFQVIRGYNTGLYTKEQAKERRSEFLESKISTVLIGCF